MSRSLRQAVSLSIGALLTCLICAAAAPEFDVASVKQLEQKVEPGNPDLSFVGTSGKRIKIAGNRVTVQGTLRTLIAAAYGVKDYQVSSEPAWADSLIFSVIAKTPGEETATEQQILPMLQTLLAERFQLKLRHETKELPVYHLTQPRTSKAFKQAAPDEKFSWGISGEPGGLRSKATKEWMGDFVQLVAVSADRPVIDQTGITGYIDYDILIATQARQTFDDQNRAIVEAVKDQLGFRLEPAKDPVEMLVVESVAKLAGN